MTSTPPPSIALGADTYTIHAQTLGCGLVRVDVCKGSFGAGEASLIGDTLRIELPSDLTNAQKGQLAALIAAETFGALEAQERVAQAARPAFLAHIIQRAPGPIAYWCAPQLEDHDGQTVLVLVNDADGRTHTITTSDLEKVFTKTLTQPIQDMTDGYRADLAAAYEIADGSTLEESDIDALIELAVFGRLAMW